MWWPVCNRQQGCPPDSPRRPDFTHEPKASVAAVVPTEVVPIVIVVGWSGRLRIPTQRSQAGCRQGDYLLLFQARLFPMR